MAARRSSSPGRRSPLPTPPSTPPRSTSRSGPNARSNSPSKSRGVAAAKPPLAAAAAAARTQLVLQLAVFLDLLGVMLVVPNLIHRFKELGISTANYGVVSSVYSASQVRARATAGVSVRARVRVRVRVTVMVTVRAGCATPPALLRRADRGRPPDRLPG